MNFAGKSVFTVPKEQHSQESRSDVTAKGGNLEKPALVAGAEGASAVSSVQISQAKGQNFPIRITENRICLIGLSIQKARFCQI